MSGTFSTLGTALSALHYNRVGMDVAAGNIANVGTEGYARRRLEGEAVGAPSQPALWSRYEGAGDGVRVAAVNRMADPFLDARARFEHGNQSYLDIRQTTLERIEAGIGEPGENGVAAAMADFRAGWGDLANNPGSDAARSQLIARANTLAEAMNLQVRNLGTEASDQQFKLDAMLVEVNTVASDLAAANKAIAVAHLNGTDAGTLLDSRDQLALRLSQLTGSKGEIQPNGTMNVTVNGVALVTGQQASTLERTGTSPVTLAVDDGTTATALPGGLRGEVGGTVDVLNVTIPSYLTQLRGVMSQLNDEVNAQHTQGQDLDGAAGGPVFSFDPADPMGGLRVEITDPRTIAAAGNGEGDLGNGNATALSKVKGAESAYQTLVNGFGTEVASARRLAANQQVVTNQVDGSREQLSGINLDEEMLSMLSHQRAYEAASRVITVVDSVLDTLINRTGLLR